MENCSFWPKSLLFGVVLFWHLVPWHQIQYLAFVLPLTVKLVIDSVMLFVVNNRISFSLICVQVTLYKWSLF